MKVIIEKKLADIVSIDDELDVRVLKNYDAKCFLGIARVSVENGVMYAELKLNTNVSGYPGICITNGEIRHLVCVGICDEPNHDKSIEPIEYTLQLEGKPSNLKTK